MDKPQKYSVALVITNGAGQVLGVKRPAGDELDALWGLPAASKESPDESWESVAHRVGKEKLGVEIELGEMIGEGTDDRENYLLTLRDYWATIASGEVVVPQVGSHAKSTQYTDSKWIDDPREFIPIARNRSVCTRIFLDHKGIDWRE